MQVLRVAGLRSVSDVLSLIWLYGLRSARKRRPNRGHFEFALGTHLRNVTRALEVESGTNKQPGGDLNANMYNRTLREYWNQTIQVGRPA